MNGCWSLSITDVRNFCSGVVWVQERKESPWKLIDERGRTLVDGFRAKQIYHYDPDSGLVDFWGCEGGWGFLDLSGEVVVSPEYSVASGYSFGNAAVCKRVGDDAKYGVIDRRGRTVLPFLYERVRVSGPRLFTVEKGGKWGCVNAKGETVIDYAFAVPLRLILSPDVLLGVAEYKEYLIDNKQKIWEPGFQRAGLVDGRGRWILPASYDRIYPGGEGLIGVERDGKQGFVDASGDVKIDFRFTAPSYWLEIYPYIKRSTAVFSEGLALLSLNPVPSPELPWNKVTIGVIDRQGELLFKFEGVPYGLYNGGLLLVRKSFSNFEILNRSGDAYPLPPDLDVIPDRTGHSQRILLVKTLKATGRYAKGQYGYLKMNVR